MAWMMQLELALVTLLAVVSWPVCGIALRLKYDTTGGRLSRRAGRLIGWTIALTIAAAGAAAATGALMMTADAAFWLDRLLLHLPLIGIPVALLWSHAVPRLRAIRAVERGKGGEPPAAGSVPAAAAPALTLPYRLTAYGTLAALYFCFRPPVPFAMTEVAVPIGLLLAASMSAWSRDAAVCRRISSGDVAKRPAWYVRLLRRIGVLALAAIAAAGPFLLLQQASKLPADIDMTAMPMDDGDGPPIAHAGGASGDHDGHAAAAVSAGSAVSVADLTGPREGTPDRRVTLTARKAAVTLASGKTVEAWTYNGQIPGPELRFKQGELVEVTLENADIEQGVTIHWHGLDVPNAEDGVAGATQNAVMPGENHVYRFRAEQAGTFWYHSHQHSKEAVQKGLFGPLVVEETGATSETEGGGNETAAPDRRDFTVISHLWEDAGFAVGDVDGIRREIVQPGTLVRMRLINTDDWVIQQYALHGAPYRVTAIDGTPIAGGAPLTDTKLELTTGGRYDIEFEMPDGPVFLAVGGGRTLGVLMSRDGGEAMPAAVPAAGVFDPLHYGTTAEAGELPFDVAEGFDREFELVLDNKLGFFNGELGMLYTMNGEVFPNTPMFMVREGELVKTTIVNRGAVDHPMHLHGHHMLVLSRNGEEATGAPWWSDTLDVRPGDVYEVAFLANNPGLWMDHCHNLTHAAAGMTMHLMYDGVYSPYRAGEAHGNFPE